MPKLEFLLLVLFIFHKGLLAEEQWECAHGVFIPMEWTCDDQFDCEDRSDESASLCPSRPCRYDEFQCDSGSCISEALECNGEVNCDMYGVDDRSDEANCEDSEIWFLNETCHYPYFLCSNGECIPDEWLCDVMDDCGDNSDEVNCDFSCQFFGEVPCNTSMKCIEEKYICDGEEDCDDGEDEQNCQTLINSVSTTPSSVCGFDNFLCGGNCWPIKAACDGKADCPGSEDEGPQCENDGGCHLRSNPKDWSSKIQLCDQICRPTPQGPKCTCMDGYRLEPDGYHCRTQGSFLPKLYYVADREIRALLLHAAIAQTRIEYVDYKTPNIAIFAIDYDMQFKTLMWIEKQSNTIKMMDESMRVQILVEIPGVSAISLDWTTKNIYVTYKSPVTNSGKVGVFSVDRSNGVKTFYTFDFQDLVNPIAIVVYPKLGQMILADQGNNKTPSRLILADMDGENSKLLTTEYERQIMGVTIDYVTDVIYWSEMNDNEARIEMMKMDGSNRKTLVSSYEHEIAIKSPVSLAVFEDILYFCDNHTREIWSVDSVTGKPKTWLHDRAEPVLKAAAVSHLVALHVYHPVMQTHAEGLACGSARCSHICVLRPGGSTCLCPENMKLLEGGLCVGAITSSYPSTPVISTSFQMSPAVSQETISIFTSETRKMTVSGNPKTSSITTSALTVPLLTNTSTTANSTTSTTTTSTTTRTITSTITLPTTKTAASTSTSITIASMKTTPPAPKPFTTAITSTSSPTVTEITAGKPSSTSPTTSSITGYLTTMTNSKSSFTTKPTTSPSYTTVNSSTVALTSELPAKNIFCSKPKQFVGEKIVKFTKPKYSIGAKVVIACLPGWHVQGNLSFTNLTLTCSKLGHWSSTKALTCAKPTCSSLDCGKYGKCIYKKNFGAVCKCVNGKVSLAGNVCFPNQERSAIQKADKPNPGLVAGCVLASLMIVLIIGFAIRSFLRKSKIRYALVDEEDSPKIKRKGSDDNGNIVIFHEQDDGIKNPNYSSPKKTKFRLPLPNDLNVSANRSGSSPSTAESSGIYSYRFLKESEDSDVYENVCEEEIPLNAKSADGPLSDVRNTIKQALKLSKSGSAESIIPRT